MRDEDYRADQLPAYGAVGQPAAVARMGAHLRTVRIGQVIGTLAIATAALALVFYGDGWDGTGQVWYILLIFLAALLDVACFLQLMAWVQASAAWSGHGRRNAHQVRRASWVVQIASYVITGAALVVGVVAIVHAGWYATSSIMVMITLILMCVALVTAAIQYVHRSGPPGAAPAHMHRVVQRQNPGR